MYHGNTRFVAYIRYNKPGEPAPERSSGVLIAPDPKHEVVLPGGNDRSRHVSQPPADDPVVVFLEHVLPVHCVVYLGVCGGGGSL